MKRNRMDQALDPRSGAPLLRLTAAVAALAVASFAAADEPSPLRNGDLTFGSCDASNVFRTFASKAGETLNTTYGPMGAWSGNVFVALGSTPSCAGSETALNCLAGVVTVKAPLPAGGAEGVPNNSRVALASTRAFTMADVGLEARWSTTVTLVSNTSTTCTQQYRFWVTSSGGGWGDPHLQTVDGVAYDFQSAGEFTALRKPGFEVQTRQTPVPTATVPIANAYTGITQCVALYTAVAAKLGGSRVTLQPGLASSEVSADGMQLRVNGTLMPLTDKGIVLRSGGGGGSSSDVAAAQGTVDGIVKRTATGAFEITNAEGTQLVVTPAYWESQRLWYLNVNVYQTSATAGTMGKIAAGSWLPALPDGTSLGPKPEGEAQRYEALYTTFANAWRVGSASLFDYATGQTTADFTRSEWPRNRPQSCAIEGQTSAPAATAEVATQACSAVTDATRRANCEFDVAVTGHTGFGKSYEAMQAYQPAGTGWGVPAFGGIAGGPSGGPGATPWWKAWWWLILLVLLLLVLLIRMFSRRAGP